MVTRRRSDEPRPIVDDDPLLTRDEAAAFLRMKPQTLAVWACRQSEGPPYAKIGRAVRYRLSDLRRFVEQQMVSPSDN